MPDRPDKARCPECFGFKGDPHVVEKGRRMSGRPSYCRHPFHDPPPPECECGGGHTVHEQNPEGHAVTCPLWGSAPPSGRSWTLRGDEMGYAEVVDPRPVELDPGESVTVVSLADVTAVLREWPDNAATGSESALAKDIYHPADFIERRFGGRNE